MPASVRSLVVSMVYVAFAVPLLAQAPSPAAVDRLLRVSGTFRPADGGTAAPVEPVRFAIYAQETGGEPLWEEVQQVALDRDGSYAALLGSSAPSGVPLELFASGEPRWLGTQFLRAGEPEQPRTLAASVPYALHAAKAADADTLGGLPASAYALAGTSPQDPRASIRTMPAGPAGPAGRAVAGLAPSPLTSGTPGMLGKFVNTTDLGDSAVYESGGRVGVGTTAPLDLLHVRFGDTSGGFTGIAVQNTGAGSNSYSGMLFYDQSGALGQFQGFNNSTHEYRINNIASSGTINFMTGSTSRLKVSNIGDVGIGITNPFYRLDVSHPGTGIRVKSTAGFSVVDIDAITGDAVTRYYANGTPKWLIGNRSTDNFFYLFNFNAATANMTVDPVTGRVLLTGSAVTDQLAVAGNIRVGTGATGCVLDSDGTVIAGTCSSDARFKKDITPFGPTIDRLTRLTPVHYFWRADEFSERNFGTSQSYGLVAQDVREVFPDLVKTDDRGYLAVNYSKLPLLTLQAVKELKAENDALKTENAALAARLAALEAAVERLQKP